MANKREIPCTHYISEYDCDLGKEGTFYHQCQYCKQYEPQQKTEKTKEKEKWD